jgi:hypothetical protein
MKPGWIEMNVPLLIGITGAAGAGKDTLADHISKVFGHVKYSLASPIKQLLNERFGWTDEMWADREWKESDNPECGRRADWEEYNYFSPRTWAQWLGTEVGREIGGQDVWVNLMLHEWRMSSSGLVVPDVRFDSEAANILNRGGVVVKVVRSAAEPVNAHVSEKGVQSKLISATIRNDGSVDEFLSKAISVLQPERRS